MTARWTWAIEAAPTGSGSTSAKTSSSGRPRPCSIAALICSNGAGGRLSCSKARSCAASSPTRSGRVASAWPSLIAAGPIVLEGLGIGRHVGHARAEAGELAQAADRRRRVGVALDAAQRAVPRQHPAPFQQPPDMDDGGGQIFQPLWMATRPPRIGSAFTLPEARRLDHPRERGHVREALDRFDQVAVAVLVLRHRLADLRHDPARIGFVERREARPAGLREFEAEEAAAGLQHAVRLAERRRECR